MTQTFAALTMFAFIGAAGGATAAGSLVQAASPGAAFLAAGLAPMVAAAVVGSTVARVGAVRRLVAERVPVG